MDREKILQMLTLVFAGDPKQLDLILPYGVGKELVISLRECAQAKDDAPNMTSAYRVACEMKETEVRVTDSHGNEISVDNKTIEGELIFAIFKAQGGLVDTASLNEKTKHATARALASALYHAKQRFEAAGMKFPIKNVRGRGYCWIYN